MLAYGWGISRMSIELSAVAAVGIASVALAIFAAFKQREDERREREERSALRQHVTDAASSIGPVAVSRRLHHWSGGGGDDLVLQVEHQIADRIASQAGRSLAEVKSELDHELSQFRDRVKRIEDRFPSDAELDKIASINDALLSERIDQLAKRMESLEARTLSRWDVTVVVSAIIGGIATVVASTVAVVQFLAKD